MNERNTRLLELLLEQPSFSAAGEGGSGGLEGLHSWLQHQLTCMRGVFTLFSLAYPP